MTARTRARIEQRTQPVAAVGGSGRRDPVVAEKRISNEEIAAMFALHVARREAEGIRRRVENRGFAARQPFAVVGNRSSGVIAAAAALNQSQSDEQRRSRITPDHVQSSKLSWMPSLSAIST